MAIIFDYFFCYTNEMGIKTLWDSLSSRFAHPRQPIAGEIGISFSPSPSFPVSNSADFSGLANSSALNINSLIAEAKEKGMEVIPEIPDYSEMELSRNALVLKDIGKNASIKINPGGIVVLGNVYSGATIETYLKTPGRGEKEHANSGITIVGKVDNHVRLQSQSIISVQDCGNFVMMRASRAILAGDIGDAANIIARERVQIGNVGSDLRATYFTTDFIAGDIAEGAVVKAGSVLAGSVGKGSELTASHHIEALRIEADCTLTARTITVQSAHSSALLHASIGLTNLSARRKSQTG